jgi:hypothetical protein
VNARLAALIAVTMVVLLIVGLPRVFAGGEPAEKVKPVRFGTPQHGADQLNKPRRKPKAQRRKPAASDRTAVPAPAPAPAPDPPAPPPPLEPAPTPAPAPAPPADDDDDFGDDLDRTDD